MLTSILLALALFTNISGHSAAQNAPTPSGVPQHELLLTRANEGQTLYAKIGQPIVVTLQNIGPGNYKNPQVSSRAVRFDTAVDPPPQERIPAGPKQIFRFTAVAQGEAQIRFTHTASNPAVTFTIHVKKP